MDKELEWLDWTAIAAANDSRPMRVHATAFSAIARRLWHVAACLLLAVACVPAAQAFDWQVEVTPAGELFPALEWSQRPGGAGGDGLVAITVTGVAAGAGVQARVDTPGLRAPAIIDAVGDGSRLVLRPRLAWSAARLASLQAPRPQRLRVALQVDGRHEVREIDVRLHPLDEAAYFVRDGSAHVDLSWIFASYVDPFAPAVDALLADARRLEPAFDVVDADAGRMAHRRLRAAWRALAERGVRYDATDPALARGPSVWSQRVRSPAQVLREQRANCIDGSVLIAAVMERLGLRARIALVPRHAFVGYRTPDSGDLAWLETTLLGATDFDAARRAGDARWRDSAPRLDGRHAPDYTLIDLGTARAYGIIPIGAALRAADPSPESAAASATAR